MTADWLLETPRQRQERAAVLHQRLQLERAIITRAARELRRRDVPPSIAASRAVYVLARGQRDLDRARDEHPAGA